MNKSTHAWIEPTLKLSNPVLIASNDLKDYVFVHSFRCSTRGSKFLNAALCFWLRPGLRQETSEQQYYIALSEKGEMVSIFKKVNTNEYFLNGFYD
jgi:hypothetical protein